MERQTNGNTFFEVKTMKKRLFAGLILICFAVIGFLKSAPAQSVLASNEGVLRLHVIAASDSEADQSVKLQVRDAILPLFSKAESYEDACLRAEAVFTEEQFQRFARAVQDIWRLDDTNCLIHETKGTDAC